VLSEGLEPNEKQLAQLKTVFDSVDWNLVLTTQNQFLDKILALQKVRNPQQRADQFKKLRQQLETLTAKENKADEAREPPATDAKSRTQLSVQVAAVMLDMMLGAAEAAAWSEDRSLAKSQLMEIAVALAAYKIDHDKYPA